MKNLSLFSLIYRPRGMREFAAERSEIAAVLANAVAGVLVVLSTALMMSPLFTVSLVILLSILFGPFVGFAVSSMYPRIERAVGERMGGKASLDELYRIFAWSILPLGFAGLFYGFILLLLRKAGAAMSIIASIPSLIFAFFALRNYCSNVIATQQFTLKRGAVSMIFTFILFLMVIAAGMGFLSILYTYGTGENLKMFFGNF